MAWIYFLAFAAVMGAIGVGGGAFGAHALKTRLTPEQLITFETAVRYWFYHALGLGIVALAMARADNLTVKLSAWSLIVGSIIFSGSLVTLIFSEQKWWGAVTPIGGVLLIIGWILLAAGLLTH